MLECTDKGGRSFIMPMLMGLPCCTIPTMGDTGSIISLITNIRLFLRYGVCNWTHHSPPSTVCSGRQQTQNNVPPPSSICKGDPHVLSSCLVAFISIQFLSLRQLLQFSSSLSLRAGDRHGVSLITSPKYICLSLLYILVFFLYIEMFSTGLIIQITSERNSCRKDTPLPLCYIGTARPLFGCENLRSEKINSFYYYFTPKNDT